MRILRDPNKCRKETHMENGPLGYCIYGAQRKSVRGNAHFPGEKFTYTGFPLRLYQADQFLISFELSSMFKKQLALCMG